MCTKYLKNKRLCDFSFHLANQKPLGLYWKITRYSLYLFSYLQRHSPTTRSIHTPTGLDGVPCFILWKEGFEMSGEHIHDQYPWKPSELSACVERGGSQEEIRCPLMNSFRVAETMAQWAKCLLLLAQEPEFKSPEPPSLPKGMCAWNPELSWLVR